MDVGHVFEKELEMKRYSCPDCGYTWIELVGLIVEKRKGLDDIHLRIGDTMPSECQKCGCCFMYEIPFYEENQQLRGRFEDIKRIIREITEI